MGFENLNDVIRYLEGKITGSECTSKRSEGNDEALLSNLDFADVKGQEDVIDAVFPGYFPMATPS